MQMIRHDIIIIIIIIPYDRFIVLLHNKLPQTLNIYLSF